MSNWINQPVKMQTSRGLVMACPHCGIPLPQPYAFQAADNSYWRRIACAQCGMVFKMEPAGSMAEATTRTFK